ncbi:MAG TPA: DUF1622 domain-containing protein [Ignavibacteria bacterium]|nr:DUF1622 domain-containing protein [Ignavibacteria bacterium]HQY52266.1 DUF1622 domain-containing protein [Ignavibacteria bacterium]
MDVFIINTSLTISYMSLIVIAYGSILGAISFVRNELGRIKGTYSLKRLNTVKIDFGYYLLLGLDFLIAADVVRTILENTMQDLMILGLSVVIRTLLSYFLGREITDDEKFREKIDEAQEGKI